MKITNIVIDGKNINMEKTECNSYLLCKEFPGDSQEMIITYKDGSKRTIYMFKKDIDKYIADGFLIEVKNEI